MVDIDPQALGTDSIDFVSAAVGYANQGWRVLPIHVGEKRPALPGWTDKATTDVPTICDWWIGSPHRNIGIATGLKTGFWVLDIDPKSGGDQALRTLEADHNRLPATRTVRTGSGGLHYYFAMPDDFIVTNSPGRLKGSGIDVRGEGGQVLAPPSVTALGAYTLEVDAPIADAPEWLLDLIRPRLELVRQTTEGEMDSVPAERLAQYAQQVALPAAVAEVRDATAERNNTLNNQVLALAGIAAHDPSLLDQNNVRDAMMAACFTNGLIDDEGQLAFNATFRSAWQAGLTKPREQWPPSGLETARSLRLFAEDGRPTVHVTGRKHNEMVDEILENFREANRVEPRLFAHGSEVVQVIGQPAHTAALDGSLLNYEADVAMHFVATQPRGGTRVTRIPSAAVDTILGLNEKPLPQLNRISYTPFFAPTGRLVTAPGYDWESMTFHSPALGMTVPEIPEVPTEAEMQAALSLILDDLLVDFPFVSQADRAAALALMLLPFVRDLINGATPLHNIEAPTPGSGKGMLMKALLMPGVGGRQVIIGAAADNVEWEKRLVTFLRSTPQALVIDNVNEKVSGGFLCTALTEPVISSRLLGVNLGVIIPVRTAWVMTANNPKFSDEVARRTIRIRIDPKVESPEDRSDFKHKDLGQWALTHRGELVAACCTLIQGWVRAGRPVAVLPKPLGSFEHWHSVMAGLFDFLGVPGLLDNKKEFLADSDDETSAWVQLVEMLKADPMKDRWPASEIADMVIDHGLSIDLGRSSDRALMMGRALAKQRDRWHNGSQFRSFKVTGRQYWRLAHQLDL